MSRPTYEEILDGLRRRGGLDEEQFDAIRHKIGAEYRARDSVLLSVLAGIGAFVAAIFAIWFIVSVVESEVALVVTAGALLAAAVGLDSLWHRETIGAMENQVVLALSFSAQISMALGLFTLLQSLAMGVAGGAAFSAIAYALIDSRENRFISALVAAALGALYLANLQFYGGGFAFYLFYLSVAVAVPAVVFGARRWLPVELARLLRPAGYAGAVVAVVFTGEWVVDWLAGPVPAAQKALVAVTAACLVAISYVDKSRERTDWWPLAVAAAIVALGLLTAASLLWAAALVGLGIWRRRRPLVVMGWVALGFHLFWFYFGLNVSSLTLSGGLIAGGLVFLGLWSFLRDALGEGRKGR